MLIVLPRTTIGILLSALVACAGSTTRTGPPRSAPAESSFEQHEWWTRIEAGRTQLNAAHFAAAEESFLAALRELEQRGVADWRLGLAEYYLGDSYYTSSVHNIERAKGYLERSVQHMELLSGRWRLARAVALARLSQALVDLEQDNEAARLKEEAIFICTAELGAKHKVVKNADFFLTSFHPDELLGISSSSPWGRRVKDGEPQPATVDAAERFGVRLESIDPEATYLAPNAKDRDGTPAYIHVTEADMPLRVSIGHPRTAAQHASIQETREAAIEGIRLWEEALADYVPWFRLEFVEEDPSAAVQIVWKRRITGPWAGFGGHDYRKLGPRIRVGGAMQVSTTPHGYTSSPELRLRLDELHILMAHEFGHVLGLGHCHDCDSAMNYSYQTDGRIVVSDLDVRTFLALIQQPNGIRVDGLPLSTLD